MMFTRMLASLLTLALATTAAADEFDRLEGRVLAEIPRGDDVSAHESLSGEDLVLLPNVLSDTRAALVVVKTDQGNLARLLLTPAFRKAADGSDSVVPILVLERFDTFEAGPATSILARGRDLVLFDGFRFDLDTGQVVPEGQGGDLQFQGAEKPSDQKLIATGGAKLFTLKASPLGDQAGPGQPSRGRNVVPTDFAGRYRLVANGQWTGTLELEVGPDGVVNGRFRSDQTGSSYRVTGQAGEESANFVRFSVIFPRSRQEYEGRLFTEGKGAIAGTIVAARTALRLLRDPRGGDNRAGGGGGRGRGGRGGGGRRGRARRAVCRGREGGGRGRTGGGVEGGERGRAGGGGGRPGRAGDARIVAWRICSIDSARRALGMSGSGRPAEERRRLADSLFPIIERNIP